MRHARMLRVLLVELLQNCRRLELVGIGRVGGGRRCLQGERVEHLGFVVVGVALRHLLHRLVVGGEPRIDRGLVMVAVVGAQRLDPVALALGLRADRARLFERRPGGLAHRRAAATAASELPSRSSAIPQYAIAQLGSSRRTPSNVRRAIRNQYEWIIATPRSNSACTLGSQEVGKLSLPSFSSCWPKALQLSAAVIPATSIRHFGPFVSSFGLRFHGHLQARAIAHDPRSGLLQNIISRMRCRPMASSIAVKVRNSALRLAALGHVTPAIYICGGAAIPLMSYSGRLFRMSYSRRLFRLPLVWLAGRSEKRLVFTPVRDASGNLGKS